MGKVKSKIKQDPKFDKSIHGFIPKEPGEVDLVGKFFVRKASQHGKKDSQKLGDSTLLCGVMFGLDWNGQGEDEMWECEVNIRPIRKYKSVPLGKDGCVAGLRIDQVMATQWGDPEMYDEIKYT